MNIEFTKEEANALVSLIDIAVKNSGLQVAEAGVVLAKKLSSAFQEKQEEVREEK